MARRLFEDNEWTEEASLTCNSVTVALAGILAILEEEGPIDLRDFHYIVSDAIGGMVAGASIGRRLGDPAEAPRVSHLRILYPAIDDEEEEAVDETVRVMGEIRDEALLQRRSPGWREPHNIDEAGC